MSRAKNLNCRCRRLPEAAMTIPLVNVAEKYAAPRYLFSPICGRSLSAMLAPEDDEDPVYGEVWEIAEDDEIEAIEDDPPRPFTVTTTVNSFAVGGVVVEGRWTDADGLFFRYTNMNPWQPHAGAAMELVDYDTTASAVRFSDYTCLRPAVSAEDCACTDRESPFIAVVEFDTLVYPDDEATDCLCRSIAGSWVFPSGNNVPATAGCIHRYTVPHSCSGGLGTDYTIQFSLQENATTGDGVISINVNGVPYWTVQVEGRTICDIATTGGEFPLELNAAGFCEGDPPTVTIIPLTSDGEARTSAPCGELYCGGTSSWYLRRKCHNGTSAYYYWELAPGDACKGLCENDQCRPTEPFALMEGRVTDEDATDAGYIAALDTIIAGGCGCDGIPAEPVCEDGCSVWTLRRELCYESLGIQYYIYYWEFENSSCSASCESGTCTAQPPYLLETDPIDDTTATALGYLDALNEVDGSGTCSCAAAYVRPECPDDRGACCYCDEMTNNVLCVSDTTLAECQALNGEWHADTTCDELGAEPSESCIPCFGDECAGGIC